MNGDKEGRISSLSSQFQAQPPYKIRLVVLYVGTLPFHFFFSKNILFCIIIYVVILLMVVTALYKISYFCITLGYLVQVLSPAFQASGK